MPKTKKQNEEIRARTKEKIMSIAIEQFCLNSYESTGISDIAKAASISTGLIYRHFSSKKELFLEIVKVAVEGLKGVSQIFLNDENPKETLLMFAKEMIYELDNPEFIYLNMLVIQGLQKHENELYKEILVYDRQMFEAAAKLIEKGQKLGEIKQGDPMVKSAIFFSAIQGMVTFKFMFNDLAFKPTVEDLTANLF